MIQTVVAPLHFEAGVLRRSGRGSPCKERHTRHAHGHVKPRLLFIEYLVKTKMVEVFMFKLGSKGKTRPDVVVDDVIDGKARAMVVSPSPRPLLLLLPADSILCFTFQAV